MEPLLSVIVPVYRAEDTLTRCVNSILSHAPENLELILVDDGSSDASGTLCDAFAAQDGRVRVIHQPNAGVSAARNRGLDTARGRYIQFVDADDWLEPDCYPTLLPYLAQNPRLVLFDTKSPDATPQLSDQWLESLGQLSPQWQWYLVDTSYLASPWGKLYHREQIGGVRFDTSLAINEDILFNLQVLPHCTGVQLVGKALYGYNWEQDGSLSRRLRTDLMQAERYTRPAFCAFLESYQESPQRIETLVQARVRHAAVAQFGLLMGRKGALSLVGYLRSVGTLLQNPQAVTGITQWLKADPNRWMALAYRICVKLGWSLPIASWFWLKGSTSHRLFD